MKLPERLYYPLPDAAEKLKCSISDVLHLGATGVIKISLFVNHNYNDKLHLNMPNHRVEQLDELFQSLHGEHWVVSNIEFKDSGENIYLRGYYAGRLEGFFYVNELDLIEAEFNMNSPLKITQLYVSPDGFDGGDLEVNFFNKGEDLFSINNLCIMSTELAKLKDSEGGKIYDFSQVDKPKNSKSLTDGKKHKLIKALIEVAYGKGSSEKPRSLLNEERGTGELLIDFQKMGIKPPVTGSTLADYLKDIELDYVGIPTLPVENSKK